MAGQSRKWMILVATIWIQAFTGTNFDFSAYSSEMKAVLGVSQVQLNYLATASDLGKAVGWSSGLALMWLPLWAVMFTAAAMGLVGYGVQWLVISNVIALPYFVVSYSPLSIRYVRLVSVAKCEANAVLNCCSSFFGFHRTLSKVFLLCLLAGCSICWFNTVCFVLCIKNFPSIRPLALSLTVSFNGVSAALYNLAVNSLNPSTSAVYLLLNALVPLFTSIAALVPILRQPPVDPPDPEVVKRDQFTFLKLNLLAVITGLYLLFLHPSNALMACFLFAGAVFLLILPLGIPGVVYARNWFRRTVYSSFRLDGSGFILVDAEDLELHKELLSRDSVANGLPNSSNIEGSPHGADKCCSCAAVIEKDQLVMLGQEHTAKMLGCSLDFWLYYLAYFCGGTIGLVYSNNIGQIAQSLGHSLMNSRLITVYSAFSFFGRLLSAAPDFIRTKFYFARTGWLTIALLPTPIAFFVLVAFGGNPLAIQAGTALIGLSSGFIFAAAVSITSELFGPESAGVNHNILITNIPIGSLIYGFLAALVYDSNAVSGVGLLANSVVCMGRKCYFWTFVWWGCISLLGLASSVLLFIRTKPAYHRFEQSRTSTMLY
ncbi:protein NUCLEAR FUSION defective [Sesamum angolense]|uniref:Protein NUCLEAR FUSION defective n=1 Tax=Sesamum angolense TaxID=2727404 RepID=A0AAE2BX66_9LAMI|nr:protein NUCLEAR FUSION defective [Sesamum angolense]